MDATRFEGLLRMLSTMPSRRGVARTAFGLALAGSLGGLHGPAPAAAKKGKKKKCKKPEPCVCPTECGVNADCPADSGKICESGRCVCPPNEFDSGGVCAPIPACVRFNLACGEHGQCCSGACVAGNCGSSSSGRPCFTDEDCFSGTCRGFVCVQP